MMWLLLFIVIAGYLIAMHKEIIMYFKLLWEKYNFPSWIKGYKKWKKDNVR